MNSVGVFYASILCSNFIIIHNLMAYIFTGAVDEIKEQKIYIVLLAARNLLYVIIKAPNYDNLRVEMKEDVTDKEFSNIFFKIEWEYINEIFYICYAS